MIDKTINNAFVYGFVVQDNFDFHGVLSAINLIFSCFITGFKQ